MSSNAPLNEFIEKVGRTRLSEILNVTRSTVHKWTTHEQAPRPATAYLLVMYSQGALTWEDIYRPFAEHDMRGKKFESVDPSNGAKITFELPSK